MDYPIVFGILLVTAAGSSVACGLYAIQNNIRTPINRVFLALGCAMLFWCLGLAITVVAANEEICAFGRRLAPIGWGTICSILLHFILLLTQKNRLLKKWWIYPLLYLPSVTTIFAYTYLPLIQLNQDHLIRNELGWLNISRTDAWDWFYYGYCLIFIAIAIIVVYLWAKHSTSQNVKKQVRLLMGSLLTAAVLGGMTDILPIFLNIRTPQISPVFVLFPIVAVSYSVNYHAFLRSGANNQNELILNESAYTTVYRSIGLIFSVGSLLNLTAQCLLNQDVPPFSSFLFSGALLSMSAFIFFMNRAKLDDSIKEMLLAAGLSFMIPMVALWFVSSGGMTIWALIFLLIIICLLFNRRTILMTVLVSSMLTQLLIWAAAPSIPLRIDGGDYILRITLIGLAAILSLHVNQIYVQRLKDNANQLSMQMLVAETSHDFVSVQEQNFNDKMDAMLKRCGSFVQSDRAYLALLHPDAKHIHYFFEWAAENRSPQSDMLGALGPEMQAMLLEQLESYHTLRLHDTAIMSPSEPLKNQLTGQDIRALLALPVKKQDTIIGFLAFTAARPLMEWRLGSFTCLEVVTNIISDAVIKVDGEKEINFIAYHDQLTLLPNRILFQDRLEKAIKRAEQSKTVLVIAFLDLDSFKIVNDTMGHELGDQLLFEAAQVLSRSIRSTDTIARFGGDEFVILLNDIASQEEIVTRMDHITEELRKPVLLNGQKLLISASVGVALYPQDGSDAETLIKNADIAMYNAKTSGKNQYCLYS